MAWTTPRTWSDAEVVGAAEMNQHVRDNFTALYDRTINAPATHYETSNSVSISTGTGSKELHSLSITTHGGDVQVTFITFFRFTIKRIMTQLDTNTAVDVYKAGAAQDDFAGRVTIVYHFRNVSAGAHTVKMLCDKKNSAAGSLSGLIMDVREVMGSAS